MLLHGDALGPVAASWLCSSCPQAPVLAKCRLEVNVDTADLRFSCLSVMHSTVHVSDAAEMKTWKSNSCAASSSASLAKR